MKDWNERGRNVQIWRKFEDTPGRIHLMDELRGLSVLALIIYHGCYDLAYIFRLAPVQRFLLFIDPLVPLFAGSFILFAGVASYYTRSNVRRGVRLMLLCLVITLVTSFIPGERILFGILHLLAACMLLFAALRPLLEKIPPLTGVLVSALLFFTTWHLPAGRLSLFGVTLWQIPEALRSVPWLFPLGLHGASFASADYFPLFPWLFLFLAGSFLGVWAKEGKLPSFVYRSRSRFLAVTGKNSLLIYLLHQPVLMAVFLIVFQTRPF